MKTLFPIKPEEAPPRKRAQRKSDWKPYLTNGRCGMCIVPFEIKEETDGGSLHVTFSCPKCKVLYRVSIEK